MAVNVVFVPEQIFAPNAVGARGIGFTTTIAEAVSVPQNPVTVNNTLYVPGVAYVCAGGVADVDVFPFPNVQAYVNNVPWEACVNVTLPPAQIVETSGATVATTGGCTVMVTVVSSTPQ